MGPWPIEIEKKGKGESIKKKKICIKEIISQNATLYDNYEINKRKEKRKRMKCVKCLLQYHQDEISK